jgi:hypothetical protein
MIKIMALALGIFSYTCTSAAASPENDWFNGSFGPVLSKSQEKAFEEYYLNVPEFALTKVEKVLNKSGKSHLTLKTATTFRGTQTPKEFKIEIPTPTKGIWVGDLLVLAFSNAKKLKLFDKNKSEIGFSKRQEPVYFKFKQMAGFSEELGLDRWITCQTDDNCIFVKTCKGFASVNTLHAAQYYNWRNIIFLGENCPGGEESYLEKYRPKCLEGKICGNVLR